MRTTTRLHTTSQVLDLVEAALASVDHGQRAAMPAGELVVLMKRARKLTDQVGALAGVITTEVTVRGATLAANGTPITSFLALEEGRDSRDAAGQVFEAGRIAKNPATRDAALAGDVSTRAASAITQTLDALPDTLTPDQVAAAEQRLLAQAPGLTARQISKLGPIVLAEVAPQLVPTAADVDLAVERQYRRAVGKRSFTWGDDGDGSTWFRGLLPHVEAAPLVKLVQAYVESDRRHERDTNSTLRAVKTDHRVIRDHTTGQLARTPAQRAADALARLVAEHRRAPAVAGDRPRIVVTITEQSLRDRATAAGLITEGQHAPAGELRRMCCDADILPVVLGSESELLDVGRTARLVTPGIRKALSIRDRGCVFPNCAEPDTACESHHIQPWTEGGKTALSNLVLVCKHHHKLLEPNPWHPHRDKWTIHIDPHTGSPIVTPPHKLHARPPDRPTTYARPDHP